MQEEAEHLLRRRRTRRVLIKRYMDVRYHGQVQRSWCRFARARAA